MDGWMGVWMGVCMCVCMYSSNCRYRDKILRVMANERQVWQVDGQNKIRL